MIGRAELQFGLQKFEQFSPKVTSEDFIFVTDNNLWDSMQLQYVIHKDLGNVGSCKRMFDG
jgi:hypothetical protein